MRRGITFLAVIAVLLVLCGGLWARPATPYEAELVVTGWLRTDARPLDAALGRNVLDVETVTGDHGELIYYVVHLDPSGFVIVSADDRVEPIIAFADDGTFEPSPAGPLGAMAANDLTGRIAAVDNTVGLLAAAPGGHQAKWRDLIDIGETPEPAFELMGLGSVSDVRVAPLLTSRWGQMQVCGNPCYNYYTPNNYPAGCVATAMAQVMRYHEYPPAGTGIGRRQSWIVVDGNPQSATTRGGDGNGGPYRWSLMLDRPGCNATVAQREAIGALCYDAGVASEMNYTADGSGATATTAQAALLHTFTYSNAVVAWNQNENIDIGMDDIINPNLDAAHPVILGIARDEYGHAIVCDGYGYAGATLYHHVNMGWDGYDDAWYNLPNINSNPYYESVFEVIYNVFTSGSGEIISGRVLDPSGNPVVGAAVEAEGDGGPFTAVADSRGVYALEKVKSYTTYTVQATAEGYRFSTRTVRTGTSRDDSIRSGNKWGIDFTGTDACRYTATEDFETGDFTRLPWEHSGACDWTVTSAQKRSGTYSARSGPARNRESTTLHLTQDCNDGEIVFSVKVSCESDWDYLTFSIDAVEMDEWSGERDWEEVSFPVTAGVREFEWTYWKDGSGSGGEDCAWIDDISLPITACPEPEPTPPPGPEPSPDDGLVGWWKLDEHSGNIATDSSGNGNHGFLRGDTQWVSGKIGNAVEFDGDGDYVDTGYATDLPVWTVCAWVKSPSAPSSNSASGPVHRERNYQLNWNHQDPTFRGAAALNVGGIWHAASFGRLDADTWYHLAATYNRQTLKSYKNGVLITSNSLPSGDPYPERGTLKFGSHSIYVAYFTGTVDDVHVYEKALTAEEINEIMTPTP